MKLFSEKLTKYKLFLLSILSLVEIGGFLILFNSYKPLYLEVFEQTKEVSKEKALSITDSTNDILKIYIHRYLQDLKIVGKHMSFLSNDQINHNTEYYNKILNNNDKNIVPGTLEELKNNSIINKKYIDYNFNYFEEYINNNDSKINIIKELMDNTKYPELNSIAYYNGNTKDNEIYTKYLISILKTNILKRFIIEGDKFEILDYILLNNDSMYIYPPKPYNNTVIFSEINNNCSEHEINFSNCIYNYSNFLIERISKYTKDNMAPILPYTKIIYENVDFGLCLNIPFDIKDNYNKTILCIEVNTTKFKENLFQEKDGFCFIIFAFDKNVIVPIYNDKKGAYDEVKNIFKDKKIGNYSLNNNSFRLFHFLYLDLFKEPNLLKNNDTLNDIFKEYEIIKNQIISKINFLVNTSGKYDYLDIEKTSCKSDLYYNGKKCMKDTLSLIIYPLKNDFNVINKDFIEESNETNIANYTIFYSLAIIDNNDKYIKWKFNQIIMIKIIKLFLFYFISSMCLIYLYFIFIHIFYESKYEIINKILNIIKDGSFFDIKDKNEIIQKKEEILIEPNNKEMLEIKNLFDYMVKTMLLKLNFEQNEIFFNKNNISSEKIDKNNKNQIINNKNILNNNNNNINNNNNNKNNIDTLNEYMDLINNINNNEIRIMFAFIISYGHYRKKLYKLSENEFKNLIIEMNIYQNKISNKNENNDSKLKDSISRCSKISYLNEYSLTNELSETTLPIIKAKLMAQKIFYLYAMCIYNQEKIKSNNENNKKYNKENAKKRYEEAIKYFEECKNISILLGTDTIRQIFSLIMISKCYMELKNYKESMINLNEALLLYSDLQKTFKDKPYFNPKIMLFAENYIFQSIMLSMAQVTFSFNKYPQSCWILMKMIESSPFIFNTIHFQTSFLLSNCLTQIESSFNITRPIDKYRKKMNKIFARINIRLLNKEKIGNKDSSRNNTSNYNPSATYNQLNTLSISVENYGNTSNLKKLNRLNNNKELFTNKVSVSINSLNQFAKNRIKNITLCMSEKLLQEINADELKDVIIKFFKKCFSNGLEEDKFGYIQFSLNGKKTISIKSDSLDIFLQKLETNKMAFKINEAYTKNNNQIQFMEFSNLLLSIIKSHKQATYEEKNDYIIIIFINTSDIRFNGEKECVDTINDLNNNNYTVIIFTYDNEIEMDKIMGIYNFVYGLNDGHFFQVKNYQQIKQVLMNFGVKDSQEKFNNYNYEITDFML